MIMQGMLVTALKAGHWVLLDEINLASAETLECLGGLLESATGSIVLADRGYVTALACYCWHFKLFRVLNLLGFFQQPPTIAEGCQWSPWCIEIGMVCNLLGCLMMIFLVLTVTKCSLCLFNFFPVILNLMRPFWFQLLRKCFLECLFQFLVIWTWCVGFSYADWCIVFAVFSDVLPVVRHADFRLFACMNPATDVGKKDLPLGIRNRYHCLLLFFTFALTVADIGCYI